MWRTGCHQQLTSRHYAPMTESTMPDQPTNRDRAGSIKPVLFLHIPKTAGTSFLMMLRNTFGDRRVHRVEQMDGNIQTTIDQIVDNDLNKLSCLTGHLPMHLLGRHLDRFQPFTILREPVARILSLYRFLRDGSPAEVKRLGLRPDFELRALLESDNPELYGQVNNGMVRQLCGDARVNTSWVGAFWNGREDQAALQAAFANLGRMDFGLAEDMHATLELARACWSVPYELREYRENTTRPETSRESLDDIREIIARNSLDLALFHQAQVLFRERVRQRRQPAAGTGWNPATVFVPPDEGSTSIAEIPGRQGFHEYEPGVDMAWVHADQTAAVHFAGLGVPVRLRMHVFSIFAGYPTGDIRFYVNDVAVPYRIETVNKQWSWLVTDYAETLDGLNRLTMECPMFLPVATVVPGSADKRHLGVAVSSIEVML